MQVRLYFPSPKYFKAFSLVGYKYFSIHTIESILLICLLKSPLFIKPTISRKCYKGAPLFVYMLSCMLHHHILPFCFKFLEASMPEKSHIQNQQSQRLHQKCNLPMALFFKYQHISQFYEDFTESLLTLNFNLCNFCPQVHASNSSILHEELQICIMIPGKQK